MPLALGRGLDAGAARASIARKVLLRAVVLFVLGLALHAIANPDPATIRIPGVLQRIAVCYLAAALLFLTTGWRTQALLAVVALAGYWAALALVPVPGFGAGDLGKEGNLAAWLDRALLGAHKSLWTGSYALFAAGAALAVLAACYWLVEVRRSRWWARPFLILGVNALAVFFLSSLLTLLLLRGRYRGADGQIRSLHAMLFDVFAPAWMSTAAASLAWAFGYVLCWILIMSALYRRGIRLGV